MSLSYRVRLLWIHKCIIAPRQNDSSALASTIHVQGLQVPTSSLNSPQSKPWSQFLGWTVIAKVSTQLKSNPVTSTTRTSLTLIFLFPSKSTYRIPVSKVHPCRLLHLVVATVRCSRVLPSGVTSTCVICPCPVTSTSAAIRAGDNRFGWEDHAGLDGPLFAAVALIRICDIQNTWGKNTLLEVPRQLIHDICKKEK